MVATSVALLLLPAAAVADAPSRGGTHYVSDFDNPYLCAGFVVHGHGVSDQVFAGFSDGTYALHVDEEVTFSYGERYVVNRSRYNAEGAYGLMRSQGRSQLWSADGRLLYTAAGQLSWTLTNGTDFTPHYDPDPLWDVVCEQLSLQ